MRGAQTECLSGLLRLKYQGFEIPQQLIQMYDDFIDLAEIIHKKLYANEDSFYDFSSNAVKLRALFNTEHPLINKKALYKQIVNQISQNSSVEDFFDSECLFGKIIEYEKNYHDQNNVPE